MIKHKIGEKVRVFKQHPYTLEIRRVSDGHWFHPSSGEFHNEKQEDAEYGLELQQFFGGPGYVVEITNLPPIAQELLFIYLDENDEVAEFEHHVFGALFLLNADSMCLVHGRVVNPSGRPLPGQPVNVFLNQTGFFIDKTGFVGHAATTVTDEDGYFEIPVLRGINVTISIPIIGFIVRGYVPDKPSVELSSNSLLSYWA